MSDTKPTITLVVAMDARRQIAIDGKIPWEGQFPEDRAHFKRVTMGHPVVMGRTTWESLPAKHRPLKGRLNIILSAHGHDDLQLPDDVLVAHDIPRVLALAAESCLPGKEEIMVIGGGMVYDLFFPIAEKMIITTVSGSYFGQNPILFPRWDRTQWERKAGVLLNPQVPQAKICFEGWARKQ